MRTLLHLLGAASPSDRRWLERYLAKPERSADEVPQIVDHIDVDGSVWSSPPTTATASPVPYTMLWGGRALPPNVALIARLVPYMLERTR